MDIVKKIFLPYFFILFLLFFYVTPAYALNSPEKISTGANNSLAPAITTDSNGKVHMVWMDAPDSWGSETISLLHSIWNGATWSAPTTIVSSGYNFLPSLAADNSGNIHLTWADANASPARIYYSKYNGATWATPTIVANPESSAFDSEIAIDSAGNPHIVYTLSPPGAVNNQSSIYHTRFNGTVWTSPTILSAANAGDSFPAIAATANGKVHFVWKAEDTISTIPALSTAKIVSRFWNGTTYSSTVAISGTIDAGEQPQPRIAVDKNNNAHVVWEECDSTTSSCWDETGPARVMYSKWNGTSWSTPFTVTSSAQQTLEQIPSLAVIADSINNIYVGWIDKTTTPLKVGFRKFNNSSSSWETAQTANTSLASADFPALTVDKWDNIHISWGEVNSTSSKYELFYDVVPIAVKIIGSSGGSLSTSNGDTMTIPLNSLPDLGHLVSQNS